MASTKTKTRRIDDDFDIESVLDQLTMIEKIGLVSGTDFWHLKGIPRLGIPAIRTSDGPNGVRGTRFFNGVPAACFPCGTGLAATWDVDLIEKGGKLMGEEAIAKGAAVILGPTVNMQRSPLGGRGFESYSEDPVLAGNMATACIKGIQSTGVQATIKHFVCNDLEDRRMASDSIVSERALREIYLKPFQIAQRDAKPMSVMTSYNKLNGLHCSESPRLLQGILRDEWGFDGLVMSDWFGLYSSSESLKAGLDLEMPGPTYVRGSQLNQALTSGKLLTYQLDENVKRVLQMIKRSLPLKIPEDAEERTIDTPKTAELLRKAAADAIVLLKNKGDVLPLRKDRKTAVIGPNAAFAAYSGGGSASLLPYHAISPLQGVEAQCKQVLHELGVPGWKRLPLLSEVSKTSSGNPGVEMRVYLDPPSHKERKAVEVLDIGNSMIPLADYKNPKVPTDLFYCDFDATITPQEDAVYEFSCSVAGTAKVFVNGDLVVDNMTKQTPGDSFFGAGTIEELGSIKLQGGKEYTVHIEFGTMPTMTAQRESVTAFGAGGIRLGCFRKITLQAEIDRAVATAKESEQVILCIGLNSDWESEGYDREHMDLPPGTDELVEAVSAANPNTIVVNQSGTPVTMPWVEKIPALLQAWYGGNETGHAIADVVFGDVNPSGKLSLSFPVRNEDNPAFLNFNSDDNRTWYGEDVYVGYRYYEKVARDVAFPFGYGRSYTSFKLEKLVIEEGEDITITVNVTNTGDREGGEVIQVYFAPENPSIRRPRKELKTFTKVFLEAGTSGKAIMKVASKYATSFWSETRNSWASEQGKYTILVGTSSAGPFLSGEHEQKSTMFWKGV
ncbi:glycoside hydrolase family 3 protein [Polychaeton citri CBS 116435]|uniref:beta-glucosidase n=1 Tax=Polychaeton citri CBS 116435 TaxID=1314669 RepID=A0A9P4Q9J5_9PEZI|nr:glycoside hydrolase family 3 protein [Polychaeton citri CBS 116435]